MTPPGQVILFTGPPAAGKSTIAAAWASSRATPTAHIDHDQARFLIRGGYISRSAAHADPALREEAERQWLLAASICESMAATYIAWGVDVAMSAFRPPGRWKGCWEQLDALDPLIVVLLASMQVLLARDAERSGRQHVGEASVRRGLAYDWDAWRENPRTVAIHSGGMRITDVVAEVEAAVQRRTAGGDRLG